VKDAAGRVCQEGKVGSTRCELDAWIETLPEPRMIAMEATIFTGWIYDHLLPHAEKVKVAHPLMLRAIAAAKRKNDTIDARKIADCLRCDLLPECHMASTEIPARSSELRQRKKHFPNKGKTKTGSIDAQAARSRRSPPGRRRRLPRLTSNCFGTGREHKLNLLR
jgi:hypothetical protein